MSSTAPENGEAPAPDEPYRSLLERLTVLGAELPVSHLVGTTPSDRLLSALVHWAEFGPKLLDAADDGLAASEAMLTGDPSMRAVPLDVAKVLMAPFPDVDLVAAEAAQAQTDRLAQLEDLVAELLAERRNLPSTTAAGVPIPETTVTTDDPPDATRPTEPPAPIDHPDPPAPVAPLGSDPADARDPVEPAAAPPTVDLTGSPFQRH